MSQEPAGDDMHKADSGSGPLVLSAEHLIKTDQTQPQPPTAPLDSGPDQAALRQMVRDAINEELTGATGERVTENIRKLIRKELRLMLEDRDSP